MMTENNTVQGVFRAPDGTELSYRQMGTGETVVCLPGGPMQDSRYLGDLGGLSARHRLIVLDLRGTGLSAAPRTSPATAATVLSATSKPYARV